MRRLTVLVALLATVLALATPAHAGEDEGRGTAAVAINTKDGSALFKFAFSVKRVMGDVVDNTNAAVAYSSCESCLTVAVSIQIVLVAGDPEVVTPENVAIAINENCTLCETLASAFQYVYGTGGPVRFTQEGKRRITEIRRQFRDLKKATKDRVLTLEEIAARIDELTTELKDIVRTELVPAGSPEHEDEETEDEETEDEETEAETTPPPAEPPPEQPPPAETGVAETGTTEITPAETGTVETETTPAETGTAETEMTTTP